MAYLELSPQQSEELLVEVITGKKFFLSDKSSEVFAVRFPTIEDRDRARVIYTTTCRKLVALGLLTIPEMRNVINRNKLLPDGFYPEVGSVEAKIKASEKARELTGDKTHRFLLDQEIESLREKLKELKSQEEHILENTVEIKAEEVRLNYLVSRCTLCGDEFDSRIWPKYEDYCNDKNREFVMLAKLNFYQLNNGISNQLIRALARTSEWKHRWKASKQSNSPLFPGPSADWDRNKISICYWSGFYDTIESYPEPPADEIMNDDDLLFEWIRDVNRLRKQQQSKGGKGSSGGGSVTHIDTPYKVRASI